MALCRSELNPHAKIGRDTTHTPRRRRTAPLRPRERRPEGDPRYNRSTTTTSTMDDLARTLRGPPTAEKNALKPWQKKEWCIPKVSAEFVAHMEDVLDLYAEPYDPKRPVVCFDETSTQLLAETRAPMLPRPGHPLSLLKEFYSSTPSRYPAGHAQEPSRPNAPGRNFPSRSPKVTGRDLLPPRPRTQKPRGKRAGSTNTPGTEPRSAWSTGGATLRNRDRRPGCSASARTVASRRFPAYRGARSAPRPTGSPPGAATPNAGERPNSPAAPRYSARHGYAL